MHLCNENKEQEKRGGGSGRGEGEGSQEESGGKEGRGGGGKIASKSVSNSSLHKQKRLILSIQQKHVNYHCSN